MPKIDIDYSNTIIYKIFCKDTTIPDLYVGYTTNFVQRKHAHKQNCNNNKSNYNYKLYDFIRNNGGWINWQMEIIAYFNYTTQYEATQKEHEICILLKATLNSPEQLTPPIQPKPKLQIDINNYKYCCNQCKYNTNFKKDYTKHIRTPKHIRETSININNIVQTQENIVLYQNNTNNDELPFFKSNEDELNDTFVSNDYINETNNDPQISETIMYKLFEIFFTKMTETMTETMTKSNQELKQTITELANRPTTINNNTNNCTITTNVFLNVNCKDAMTLETYLNGIKVEPAHIWLMMKEGSCAGFCEILKSSMNQIKLTDRPIHCTDPKRNTHWIKHETGWEKELENKSMNRVCSRIKHRSGQTLMNIIDADPEYKIPNTDKNETMLKLMKAATGSGVSGGQDAIDATIIKYAEDNVIHLTKDKMTHAIQTTGP